jgi:hypothetical protein
MIKLLENPKTNSYKILKNIILGREFPWFFNSNSTESVPYDEKIHSNFSFYSHGILIKPGFNEIYYPKVNSGYIDLCNQIFLDITSKNNINPMVIYRINVNAVHPSETLKYSVPHVDHDFPHKNMLIYLTNPNGGEIICEGESILPNEDDVVILEGEHYIKSPSHGRRIVLVYTFLGEFDE